MFSMVSSIFEKEKAVEAQSSESGSEDTSTNKGLKQLSTEWVFCLWEDLGNEKTYK